MDNSDNSGDTGLSTLEKQMKITKMNQVVKAENVVFFLNATVMPSHGFPVHYFYCLFVYCKDRF